MCQRHAPVQSVDHPAIAVCLAVEVPAHRGLRIEGLDHPQTRDRLLYRRQYVAPEILSLQRRGLQPLADCPQQQPHNRQKHKDEYRQLPAHIDHHSQTEDDHHRIAYQSADRGQHAEIHLADIARDARHDIPLALISEKAYRQREYLRIHLIADIALHSVFQRYKIVFRQIIDPDLEEGQHHKCSGQTCQSEGAAMIGYKGVAIIVEIADKPLLGAHIPPGHSLIMPLVEPEQHLQDRDQECE